MCSWEEAAILLKKEILYLDNRNICWLTIPLKIYEEKFGSGQVSIQLKSQFSIALDKE